MRPLRKNSPSLSVEMWGAKDVMNHLNCDKMKANEIVNEIRELKNQVGYGPVLKEWVLDYLAEKERIQRERDMRYKSDLSNVERLAVLREQVRILQEQVRILQEMCRASSEDARKARYQSLVSNVIAIISLIVAIVALIFK